MSDRSKRRLGISIGAVLLLALLIAGLLVMLSGGSATAKQIATLHIFEGQVEIMGTQEALERYPEEMIERYWWRAVDPAKDKYTGIVALHRIL